ncbi:hypothetical protein [Streptomyces sp. NPDC055794]
MSTHRPKHRPAQDEQLPATAADEILREAEDAETAVVDDGQRREKDCEARTQEGTVQSRVAARVLEVAASLPDSPDAGAFTLVGGAYRVSLAAETR